MTTSSNIQNILKEEDIEGLLALGAPGDEYSYEANDISIFITALNGHSLTEADIVPIVSRVWAKYFNLSKEDLNSRNSAFQRVAQKILG